MYWPIVQMGRLGPLEFQGLIRFKDSSFALWHSLMALESGTVACSEGGKLRDCFRARSQGQFPDLAFDPRGTSKADPEALQPYGGGQRPIVTEAQGRTTAPLECCGQSLALGPAVPGFRSWLHHACPCELWPASSPLSLSITATT